MSNDREQLLLSEREQQFLKNHIRDNSPMPVLNPMPPQTGFVPLVADAEVQRWKTEPKMKPVDMNDDREFQKKISDAGFKGKPGEFYATVGLSRQQALAMSKSDLRAVIEAAKGRDDVPVPRAHFSIDPAAKPARVGPRFVQVGD